MDRAPSQSPATKSHRGIAHAVCCLFPVDHSFPKGQNAVFAERGVNKLPTMPASFVQEVFDHSYLIGRDLFHIALAFFGAKIDHLLEVVGRMSRNLVFKLSH
jgi:hypothetical protein